MAENLRDPEDPYLLAATKAVFATVDGVVWLYEASTSLVGSTVGWLVVTATPSSEAVEEEVGIELGSL